MSTLNSTQTTLIKDLISFDTTSIHSNLTLITHVANQLDDLGAKITLNHNKGKTKANLLATIGPADTAGGIILSGHTDTVPVTGQDWRTNPYEVTEENGKIFARGSVDMKGFCGLALAQFIETAKTQSRLLHKPLSLLLTYDEEVGCFGAKNLIHQYGAVLPKPELVLIGEPTSLKANIAHKGIRCFNVHVKGHGCHSSNPDAGISAIEHSHQFIGLLYQLREEFRQSGVSDTRFSPSFSTINVATVNGGSAINVVPDECVFSFETRTIPGDTGDYLVHKMKRCFEQAISATGAKLKVNLDEYVTTFPFAGDEHHSGSQFLISLLDDKEVVVAPFCTEASAFQENGWNTIVCGPGSIEQAHQPNEFITIQQLERGANLIERVTQRCLTAG